MPQPNRFDGRIVQALQEQLLLPDGTPLLADVVRHPGGAAVVAVDDARRVCLLHQFRPVLDEWLWEIPAGTLDPGEPPAAAAERELREETGLTAGHWRALGNVVSSPGVFTERVHLYLATILTHGAASPAADELFQRHWLDLDDALARARDGAISDSKTVVALWRAAAVLGREP